MEITHDVRKYFNEIIDLAYQKYTKEAGHHGWLVKRTKQSFASFLKEKMHGMNGIVGVDSNHFCGFLLYSQKGGQEVYCDIPTWGYGADSKNSVRIMGCLFQYLADKIVLDKKVRFSVRLYAHDEEAQKLFSLMQFGIQSEKGIRRIGKIEYTSKYEIRELNKEEVRENWEKIWELLSCLIDHLRKSPVFYPCDEFTEGIYKEFFADSGTRVFAATDEDELIGLVEANLEGIWYLPPDTQILNVGEIYVKPEFRGKGTAQALLHCVDSELKVDGVDYEWVEHGTSNPTARGFWNKYFETFEYEFIRTIE